MCPKEDLRCAHLENMLAGSSCEARVNGLCDLAGGIVTVISKLLRSLVNGLTDLVFEVAKFGCDALLEVLHRPKGVLEAVSGKRTCFPCAEDKEFTLAEQPDTYSVKAKIKTPKVCMKFDLGYPLVDCEGRWTD